MEESRIVAMSAYHECFIYAALLVSVIRFILRTVFVVLTESVLGIGPILFSMLAFVFLLFLQRKGGCSMVVLYFLVEPLLCTIWWCLLVFALDTN